MINWRNEPLLHFLLIGIVIFFLYSLFGSRESSDIFESKNIVVDRSVLLKFMQYRTKQFNSDKPDKLLDSLSDKDLKQIIKDYVREEALYREGLSLGLDRNDYIIRRRLIQKLEFISSDLNPEKESLTKEKVMLYFNEHRDDYQVTPVVTFTHVFFDSRNRSRIQARDLAALKLDELNKRQVPFNEGARYGDRFLYHTNYVDRPPELIASHFGPEMAGKVLKLDADDQHWFGPYESLYGFHLVMVTKNVPGRYLKFKEISIRVQKDARQASIKEQSETIIKKLIDSYTVQNVFKPALQENTKKGVRP